MRLWIALAVLSLATPVSAQTMGSSSGASSSLSISNPSDITTKTWLYTPPGVVAPGLAAAGIETCLGSTSGGLSLMGGGFSFGRTQVDEGCTIRLLARQLYAFGLQKAALALMCQDERVALAMEVTGSPCPQPRLMERNVALVAEAGPRGEQMVAERPISRAEQAWFDRASN